MIGVSEDEARTMYETYDKELPFVKEAADHYSRFAAKNGYIKMIDGARGHFNLWEAAYRDFNKEAEYARVTGKKIGPCSIEEAERRTHDSSHPWNMERLKRAYTHKAFNRTIQGSAARQTKMAMVNIWSAGFCPLIQMHDELGFSLSNESDGVKIKELMIEAVRLTIPVMVDLEWGVSWGKAAKNKKSGYTATWQEAFAELK
jgi:DNA polymerase I-like protein with 3'-5' exonuclease and polymerase domains